MTELRKPAGGHGNKILLFHVKPENKNQTNKDFTELVEFTVNGMTMSTRLTKKFSERKKWTKPDEKKVVSFIPGTIRELFIKEGDKVEENDRLLTLEAMKMVNVIVSPVTGKISKIHIATGDKVPKGKVMVELDEAKII